MKKFIIPNLGELIRPSNGKARNRNHVNWRLLRIHGLYRKKFGNKYTKSKLLFDKSIPEISILTTGEYNGCIRRVS